ncbi:sulfotransferase family protein [Aliiruegeria haliotis]|uniref:Sulfotransferase family protein n=1 Tax=Aliiruegeria haliotis TaxID=1280846 RepID=A0A2T0RKR0_9RHOB|nr:sulfotransferase [Aliiruegeria haliotis]PRY21786.1 sulfotransferase family protein [Aliiruegeria haliotis]
MKHVFVVTYGRSGSTALMMALNAIEGACIRGQNGGVLEPLVEAARVARITKRRLEDGDSGPRTPWYGAGEIQPQRFARSMARSFVQHILVPPEGTRVAGFSGIGYTADTMTDESFEAVVSFILRHFEDSRIIFLTRDPEAVSHSGWWQDRDHDAVVDMLHETIHRFELAHQRFPERSYMLDHASFDQNPEGLRPLLDWLGEDVPPDRLAEALSERLSHLR